MVPDSLIKFGIPEHIRDIDGQIQKQFFKAGFVIQDMALQFRDAPDTRKKPGSSISAA